MIFIVSWNLWIIYAWSWALCSIIMIFLAPKLNFTVLLSSDSKSYLRWNRIFQFLRFFIYCKMNLLILSGTWLLLRVFWMLERISSSQAHKIRFYVSFAYIIKIFFKFWCWILNRSKLKNKNFYHLLTLIVS